MSLISNLIDLYGLSPAQIWEKASTRPVVVEDIYIVLGPRDSFKPGVNIQVIEGHVILGPHTVEIYERGTTLMMKGDDVLGNVSGSIVLPGDFF